MLITFSGMTEEKNIKLSKKARIIFSGGIFLFVVILFFTIFGNNVEAAQSIFAARKDYNASSGYLFGLVNADINGDGNLDVIGNNSAGIYLPYLINRGDGFFVAATTTAGATQNDVASEDFDEDGYADIVAVNGSANTIMLMFATGDGSFETATSVVNSAQANNIKTGDFNNDGHEDIITDNDANGGYYVLLGTGSGTFAAPVLHTATTTGGYRTFALGDFNNDGKLDIASGLNIWTCNIVISLGDGDGTFTNVESCNNGDISNYGHDMVASDFNGDGYQDLAAVGVGLSNQKNISVLLSNGDGTFGAVTKYNSIASYMYGISADDVDGDTKTDLIVGNPSSAYSFYILAGNGDGTFDAAVAHRVDHYTWSVTSGDYNNDGYLDVITGDFNGNFSVNLNDGLGRLAPAIYSVGNYAASVASGDLNSDGITDLVVANTNDNNLSVFIATATGTYAAAVTYNTSSTPYTAILKDFDGDGVLDVINANYGDGNANLRLGVGDGTFGPVVARTFSSQWGVGVGAIDVTADDFNNDGKLDLAFAENSTNYRIAVFLNTSPTGTFSAVEHYNTSHYQRRITSGDINDDGYKDLVTFNNDIGDTVSVFLNDGDGTFGSPTHYDSSYTSYGDVTIEDFNDDGKMDIAASSYYGVSIFLNGSPTGTLSSAVFYNTGANGDWRITSGDFNNDGKIDLAAGGYNSQSDVVSIILGKGDGTFSGSIDYNAGSYITEIDTAYLYSLAKKDLTVISGSQGKLYTFKNIAPVYGLVVSESSGTTTIRESSMTDSYSIWLNSQPTNDVVVHVSPASQVDTDVSSLTFTSANWSTPQTITVSTTNDYVAKGQRYGVIRHTASSTDPNYDSVAMPNIVATIIDNDNAGVTIAESGSATNITEDGATDSYTVALTSQPTADVNIAVSASTTQATASPTTLIFTSANWSTPQTVTISAVDNDIVDGSHTSTITHTATSTDWVYNNLSISSVTSTISDNDTYGTTTSTIVGDFNGDGNQDLAVAKWADNNVSIYFGVGNGTFGSTTTYAVGTRPMFIASDDFDADGLTDLVAANSGSDNVSVLLGISGGTFASAVNYSVSSSPYAVTVGDFNGDGNKDLATANYGADNVSVLFGVGDGTFGTGRSYSVGDKPISIAAADFNGDNKADLSVANYNSDNISILINSGTGTLGTATNYVVGEKPFSVAAANFDTDSDYDLAVANSASSTVSILLNAGTGTFGTATNHSIGTTPHNIKAVDIDGNGVQDLITANYGGSTVSVLKGVGDETFGTASSYSLGTSPEAVVAAKFNSDFWYDLIVADNSVNNYSFLQGYRDGIFSNSLFADAVNYTSGLNTPAYAAVDDFNGDNKKDLAIANVSSANINIYVGVGDGTFVTGNTYGTGGDFIGTDVAADFNSDGKIDLASANWSGGSGATVSVFLGNGDGTFAAATNYTAGTGPFWIVAEDLNNDGKLDLAVTNFTSSNVSVFIGVGDGTFAAAVNYTAGAIPTGLTADDFNGDGYKDLAIGDFGAVAVSVLINDGDGTFGSASTFNIVEAGGGITSADFNGDGKIDLASANYGGGGGSTISILLGVGNGTFGSATNYTVGGGPLGVIAADFNLDSKLDLAVSNLAGTTVSVLLGNGDGTFGSATDYTVGGTPITLTSSDINSDSKSDLVVARYSAGAISVLLNTYTTGVGVTVSATGGQTVVSEEDTVTDTYTVVLDAQPSSDVIITPVANSQVTVSPASLTFTSSNWYTSQTFTLTAVNDRISEGRHSTTLNHTATSDDSGYNGITISGPSVEIQDRTVSGGGGGGGFYSPPVIAQPTPVRQFVIKINQGEKETPSPLVSLYFSAHPASSKMVVSPYPDFRGAAEEDFKNNKPWNLCYDNLACPEGNYVVYAKFFPETGASPEVVSSIISYHKPDVNIISLSEPIKINGGAITTDNPIATLSFKTDKAVTKMIVSPYSDFHFAKIETFAATKKWNLCYDNPICPEGIYRVHVKFFTDTGAEFGPYFAGIEYRKAALASSTAAKVVLSAILKKDLKPGIRGDDVKLVQSLLAKDKGVYPEGLVTGLYGALTKKAVERFQLKYSILEPKSKDYGLLTKATREKLQEISSLTKDSFFLILKRDLKLGASGNDVRVLQELLKTMPAIYPEGLVTGYFGALSKKAVVEFQLKFKLVTSAKDKEYGILGRATRAKIGEVFGQ